MAIALAGMALVASLGACTAHGPPRSGLGRQVYWYQYLGGEDIRQDCAAGGVERIRFVYHALYADQVRGYEFARARGADVGGMGVQAWGSPALLGFRQGGPDLGGPISARTIMDASQMAELKRVLAASGFDGAPPVGAELRSDRFFWTVSACREGRFHFNAFLLDRNAPVQPAFAETIFALDHTSVPIRPPRPTGGPLIVRDPDHAVPQTREDLTFRVPVGPDGLDTGFP